MVTSYGYRRHEDLNTPHEDIIRARVTLVKHGSWRRYRDEACVEVRLERASLDATQTAKTPYDALYAALKTVERKLHARRALDGTGKTAFEPRAGSLVASG